MVVVMQERATDEQVQRVISQLVEMGFDVHRSTGRAAHGASARSAATGPAIRGCSKCWTACRKCCASPSRTSSPAARSSRKTASSSIGDVRIGGDEVIVMAGPCSAETEEQVEAAASAVKRAGAKVLRGGAFKPRSSPYSFQGLGEEGLRLLRGAADRHNLKLVSEVMDISQLELMQQYADILQVGARNMQNFTLLRELGHARTPVLLKRGISATIEEWLLSAEYILAGGNMNVMLCERGIRTFESYTRNTLDISAIPVVRKLSHLPILVDPEPRHGPARQGRADGARRGRRRRRRPADRGAPRSRSRPERWRAVAVPGAVRSADGRTPHHRPGDRPQHLPRAGREARLGRLKEKGKREKGKGKAPAARASGRREVSRSDAASENAWGWGPMRSEKS